MAIPIALTIAGSDSGGGAGIQADLKTFSALGVYGASVITAITAQNTRGVSGVADVAADMVTAQLDAVFQDLEIAAVKIGMLSRVDTIAAVAAGLRRYEPRHVVLDPVMVAKSGDRLLHAEAIGALIDQLLPLATLVTPNLPEAMVLGGWSGAVSEAEMPAIARAVRDRGAQAVLLKGGHLDAADSPDLLVTASGQRMFRATRRITDNTHGTGCTLSSAIAALLARGKPLDDAIAGAKAYLTEAIAAADQLEVGHGHGPVHHFHALWTR
ncbi:bifunctional hydroxymethylpyrimidine kinase/phosphomethylpyrimidine kinase [Rhodoligotrophos defluvii]|uniref:bifunctional hydroxymethylpyrimidine kinase/phosphomethylpyrimidine kinase n=1 Tax=Rhodoligotrophos defluvii TaxID=2561934 RepID=UPI0010CA1CBB|nr:bifunctional hydroxymethylpyrimidine kinase/phosphomethylpyrimidine kinase [Rhodoligotrophos defluvii]